MKTPSGNFGELIHEAVRLFPDKTALISGEGSLTYRELDRRMNRAGNLFRSHGIKRGDTVALMFPNDYRFIEICFGLMRIGAVPVPLNIKQGADTLAYMLADSEANLLVFHDSLLEKVEQVRQHTTVKHSFSVGNIRNIPFAQSYDQSVEEASPALEIEQVNDDDLCFLLYTSGSTGKPKGCMLTHGGQWWNADTNRKILMVDRDDCSLVAVPLYHKNAMINAVKPCLMAGAQVVILPKFDPQEVIEAIERYRITYTTGVPAMYKLIVSHYREHPGYDLSSLRFVLCGSSEVPVELMKDLTELLQVDVLEAYGLTEGGPQVLVSPRWGIRKQGSAGLPLPGSQVRVVSLDGEEKPVPPHTVGELWVRNPGVAKGYWKLPEVTRERITPDGWLKTGDLVRFDSDGYGYIVGRKDDMMIIGGENAYPKEIEDILLRHPDIVDVCVLPVNHDIKGKVPVAFLKAREGSSLTEQEVKEFFLNHGPAYAHPRKVIFLDEMPLAGTGKIDKAKLRERLSQEGGVTGWQ